MKRMMFGVSGVLVALLSLVVVAAPAASDDDDAVGRCEEAFIKTCLQNGGDACGKQAVQVCRRNISTPQHVFSGPVTSTPVACVDSDGLGTCSAVSGTVADPSFCGGQVTIYIMCPAGLPVGSGSETPTTTVLAQATSDPATCAFGMTASNAFAGPTGCYGLIAVTPPVVGTDPGWSTCTGGACPTPKQ